LLDTTAKTSDEKKAYNNYPNNFFFHLHFALPRNLHGD
jgi:hypothetical protein